MIFGVMLDAREDEEKDLRQYLSELTAHYTDEKLEIQSYRKSSLFVCQLENLCLLDVAIIDVTLPGALEAARWLRKRFSKAEILVIADVSISPMKYMHPSIRASGLLLRPKNQVWKKAIKDFYEQLLRKNGGEKEEGVLRVENRDGTFRIPFEQIFYLEAREKKVFIRTRMEEFAMSGTIERFSEQLPENFKRCHRSFIVNSDYIVQVRLSENMLYLRENLFVPLSRSYKGDFKRHFNE